LSAKGSSTGNVTIEGLPFAVGNSAHQNVTGGGPVAFYSAFDAGITTAPHVWTNQNSTVLGVRKNSAGGLANMAATDFGDTSQLNFTVTYSAVAIS
jgi:hypothetical protein